MTTELAEEIRRLKRVENLYDHQIAAKLGINQGRVSEVLTGKRFSEQKSPQRSFDF